MPNPMTLNPLVLVKLALWIVTIAVATLLLVRRKVTSRVRLAFVVGGVLISGFLFGALIPGDLNPNPVASLRTLLTTLLVRRQFMLPVAGMLVLLLVLSWVSNKSICGWGCQLGLLQDLLDRLPLPKWRPPFWLSNSVRIAAFAALVILLLGAGLDWIGIVDPFRLFQLSFTWPIATFSVLLLAASLFVYRPWCRFLCPFGLLSWLVEQVSLFRPQVDRDICRACRACVKACPSGAMAGFYAGKRLHADCFACGRCIDACPQAGALQWHSGRQR